MQERCPFACEHIILHIGRHKTGTSSLQHFLANNVEPLRALNVLYPRAMRRYVAHHDLAYFCSPKRFARLEKHEQDSIAREYQHLREEVAGADCALFSSEAFQNASPKQVADTIGSSATVVVYLREQFDYLLSAYAQAVKNQKLTASLEEYESKTFRADYFEFLCEWQRAFRDGRLVVRLFNKRELVGSDIRTDFFHAIGRSQALSSCVYFEDDKNVSIDGTLLEFKRRLNGTSFELLIAPSKLYQVLQRAALSEPALNNGRAVSFEFALKLREKFAQSNEAVRRHYFPSRKTLFEIGCSKPPRDRGPVLSFNDVARVVNEVDRSNLGTCLLQLINGE